MVKFSCELRGANFRTAEDKAALKECATGDELYLLRDPHNEYDENAVAIYADVEYTFHVGFVAKETAEELAPLLDDGMTFRCFIHSWLSTLKPYVIIEEI